MRASKMPVPTRSAGREFFPSPSLRSSEWFYPLQLRALRPCPQAVHLRDALSREPAAPDDRAELLVNLPPSERQCGADPRQVRGAGGATACAARPSAGQPPPYGGRGRATHSAPLLLSPTPSLLWCNGLDGVLILPRSPLHSDYVECAE